MLKVICLNYLMQNLLLVRLTKIIIATVVLVIALGIAAPTVSAQDQITSEQDLWLRYEQRLAWQHEADRALLTWGVASLLGGGLFSLTDIGDFGLMTAGWGAVNTAFAARSLLNPTIFDPERNDISELLRYEQRYNRIVAINTGLNVSYIAIGLGMNQYGEARRTREFGAAIFTQGAFLLVYDSILLYLSSRYLDGISLYPAVVSGVLPNQGSYHSGGFTLNVQF